MLIHATSVAVSAQGVLALGPSGAGKSHLAFRLVRAGAWLVADDQTILSPRDGQIWAACPPTIAGRLEVRGLGIVAAQHQWEAPLRLVLDLGPANRGAPSDQRMPEFRRWSPPRGLEETRPVPCVPFDAFRPDAAEAVIAALAQCWEWEDSPAP